MGDTFGIEGKKAIEKQKVAMNEEINEERYQFVLSLYLIRTQYPQMGLFQPDFIWVIFRSSMTSKYNRTDANIKEAVKDWCDNPVKATIKYGHISEWNTSLVTDMNDLFKDKTDFNDDISKWNVRNVTDMSGIFSGEYGNTGSFNGDISRWNVSSVTNMSSMFHRTSFNGDISGWNVSSVTNMSGMFFRTLFNGGYL